MRLGTWNLAGRWSDDHREFLEGLECDVLLLTEVSDRAELPGMTGHVTKAQIARRRHWAGIWSRHPLTRLADPHGATAMAEIRGLRFCSSILPWRSCGSREPWVGSSTAERTINAVDAIAKAGPDVWGGDWNHALDGRENAGSKAGRIEGLLSIDHIAVPTGWSARVKHHSALLSEGRLSDHDAYVLGFVTPLKSI